MTQETYTPPQLVEILALHRKWAHGEAGGQRADLRGADLQGADLQRAYLQGAYLQGADLQRAYLQGADLRGAYLQDADLQRADLRGADLQRAYLQGADLRGADLQRAYLQGADLQRAYLQGADLQGADLRGAYLQDADLRGAEGLPPDAITRRQIVPQSGAFDGYKKLSGGTICRVRIPEKAARVGGLIGRKCRAEFVEVLAGEGLSIYDGKTKYTVGEIVKPGGWDPNPLVECSGGIHFYLTELEAKEHQ